MVHDDQYLVTHTRVSGLSNAGDEPPHVRPNANRPRLAWCSEERCTKHTGGTSGHVESRQNGLRGRREDVTNQLRKCILDTMWSHTIAAVSVALITNSPLVSAYDNGAP